MRKKAKGQTPPTPLLFVFSISHLLCLILNPPFCGTLTLEHSQNNIPKISVPITTSFNVTRPSLENSFVVCRSFRQHCCFCCLFSYGLTTFAVSTQRHSRLKVSVSDEDAGLISTDAKDLKVSLKISHCDNCGGAERDMEREDGTKSRGWGVHWATYHWTNKERGWPSHIL